jgi:site-specific DNA-methyltransferase (adenine-specific)
MKHDGVFTDVKSGVIATDEYPLWIYIFSKLPKSLKKRLSNKIKNGKPIRILNVAAGFGTEAKVCVKFLVELGMTIEQAFNSIYLIDSSNEMCFRLEQLGFKNVIKTNFLEWTPAKNMKFDIIIGNPPYHHPTNKRWKLWKMFIEKIHSEFSANGFVMSMVIPSTWVYADGPDFEEFRQLMLSMHLDIVDLSVDKFFKVGEDICYVMASTSKSLEKTIVIDQNHKEIYIDFDGNKLIEKNKISGSIIKKIQDKNLVSFGTKACNFLSAKAPMLARGTLKENYSEEFCVEIYHTANCRLFSKPNKKLESLQGPKLIINGSGYYYDSKNPDRFMVISDSIIAGRAAIQINVSSLQEAKNVKSFMSSKLYRFLVETTKTGGFILKPIGNLPLLSFNKTWTDQEIFDFFGLSNEEIQYVQHKINELDGRNRRK